MKIVFRQLLSTAVIGASLSLSSLAQEGDDSEVYELSPFAVTGSQDVGYRATSTLAGTRIRTPLKDVGSAVSVLTQEFFEDTGATDAETVLSYALNTEVSGVNGNFADGLGGNHNGRAEQDQQRRNPQGSQRVRGLAEASLTRNFFLTDIPFDDYNTSRVDISRGANSLLFGVGSPGGIINNTVNQASADGQDFGEISFRIGERGSHRETIDYHQVLLENRLAVRVSGLYEDTQYQQNPAYEIDKRLHAAVEAVLADNEDSEFLGRTILRGNGEFGKVHGTPPNIIPPTDSLSSFFELPNASLANVPGVVLPDYTIGIPAESRTHPEIGVFGLWQPRMTYDNRIGLSRGTVPNLVESPLDRNIYIAYPSITASSPNVGLGADGPQAMTGTLYGNGIDNPSANGALGYIWSNGFFGSNRNGQSIPNFTAPVIMNPNVWDNASNLITGTTNQREQRFDVISLALEQSLLDGSAGIELAYDKQNFEQDVTLPFSYGETVGDNASSDVKLDLSEYLLSGEPNPNVGRPVMAVSAVPDEIFTSSERESYRATAFYTLDLKEKLDRASWLGSHTFTAFYNTQNIENFDMNRQGKWTSDTVAIGSSEYVGDRLNGYFRNTHAWVYMGPSVLDPSITSPSQVRLDGPMQITLPQEGDFYTANVWNRDTQAFELQDLQLDSVLVGGGRRKQELDTKVLSWQGRLFNDNIVGLYGWRDDDTKTFENIPNVNDLGIPQQLPTGEINPDRFIVNGTPGNVSGGETTTWSIVGHMPKEWLGENSPISLSAHYSESENFQPSATRRDIRGQVLAPPSGLTKEKGFSIGLFENRLSARFNWYETASSGASISLGTAAGALDWAVPQGLSRWVESRDSFNLTIDEAVVAAGGTAGQFGSYEEVFAEIINFLPADIQAQRQYQVDPDGQVRSEPNPGQTATRDFVSEGFEVELVANLTSNWRLALNVGQQEAVQDNTGRSLSEVVTEIDANIRSSVLADFQDTPARNENQTFTERYQAQVVGPLAAITARDGTQALELREWRVNAITTYDFREGVMKGFGLGGAIRYQSKNAVGYPNILDSSGNAVPKLDSVFFGPDQTNIDLWLSYGRTLSNDVDWKIQLNTRNILGDNNSIPVVINPDGNLAVVRNPNPKTFFVTNTFSF